MKTKWRDIIVLGLGLLCWTTAGELKGDGLSAEQQAKIDAKVKQIQEWASSPVLVKAVQAHNGGTLAATGMDQEKWKGLTLVDPLVRAFTKSEAGQFLKEKKDEAISEAFLSGLDGTKVAFLSKPTNWSHKGKPKHDQPLEGKVWQGAVEVDESTGQQQVQVAVPVLDQGKAIGSLVVGLSLSKLEK